MIDAPGWALAPGDSSPLPVNGYPFTARRPPGYPDRMAARPRSVRVAVDAYVRVVQAQEKARELREAAAVELTEEDLSAGQIAALFQDEIASRDLSEEQAKSIGQSRTTITTALRLWRERQRR